MQYGHCVVSATATAINSLYLSGIAPPLKAASSNAANPFHASGANSPSFLSFANCFMSYIAGLQNNEGTRLHHPMRTGRGEFFSVGSGHADTEPPECQPRTCRASNSPPIGQ